MSNNLEKFEKLIGADLFRSLQNGDVIDIVQLNAVIALLIKLNLTFTLNFNEATNQNVAAAQLNITLSPNMTLTLLLPFARGPVLPLVARIEL